MGSVYVCVCIYIFLREYIYIYVLLNQPELTFISHLPAFNPIPKNTPGQYQIPFC